jgi:hypothetical protein
MINISEMINMEIAKINEEYNGKIKDKELNYKARVRVYKMLRYKLTNKTKVMSYDEYSDYMRLESSILFTDLTYKPRRTLRNGYDHLYNEFEPLFKRLEIQEVRDICSKCLNFSKDITKFEELKKYLQYEPVRTYIRFIASRYNPVLSAYDKKELLEYCDEILEKSKKINKGRV